MSRPEHLAKLREGGAAWNAWREQQGHHQLVDLKDATLRGAALSHADLTRADLTRADVSGANLTGANLKEATLAGTVFRNTTLTGAKGLDQCKHLSPSTIDFPTLARSGPLPEGFLRGCGLPDDLIAYLRSHRKGEGVTRDYGDAVIKWCRKTAEEGNAEAQHNLALMYAKGEGLPQDWVEAVRWCQKAADQGHAGAQYNLGVAHQTGVGVPKDPAEAVKWYRKAADQGYAGAQCS